MSHASPEAIKNALTAIGFGARMSGKTWMGGDGTFHGTALSDIIKDPAAREQFLADAWVKNFLAEQRVIEDTILDHAEKEDGFDAMCEVVRKSGPNGKVSRGGKLAFIYQHYETAIMDLAIGVLNGLGIQPVARIHDMPDVDVHILPAAVPRPSGIGEPGTPVIAPALANAIASIDGKPIHTLPFSARLSAT